MVTPAGMVFGVLLEPGERVVSSHRDDPGWQKPFLIVFGILTLFAFIGVLILYAGIIATTRVFVVTIPATAVASRFPTPGLGRQRRLRQSSRAPCSSSSGLDVAVL